MKSLSTFVTEALIQPHEIGMPTDMMFRTIALNSDISLVQNEKARQERLRKKADSIQAKFEEDSNKE